MEYFVEPNRRAVSDQNLIFSRQRNRHSNHLSAFSVKNLVPKLSAQVEVNAFSLSSLLNSDKQQTSDWQVQTELAAVRWLDCLAWRVPPKYSAEHKRLRHLWSLSSVRLGPSGEEIQVTGRQMTRCGKRNCRTVSFCWADRTSSHASSSEDHVVNTFTRRKYSFFFQRFGKT